jgi:hypothetical protein
MEEQFKILIVEDELLVAKDIAARLQKKPTKLWELMIIVKMP